MQPPIGIADIDLSAPLRPCTNLDRYTALRALVRLHGEPLGEVLLPIEKGQVSTRVQAAAIRNELHDALLRACLRNGLATQPSPDGFALHTLLNVEPPVYDGPKPRVTVAVCTRDRPRALLQCLHALQRLRYPNVQVLVVDNAPSTEATRHLVASAFPEVRYIREPRPGLDWARNRAILEARGEIVAFTDDDVIVDPGWIDAMVPLFTAAPDVACVTGLVLPSELETDAQILFEQYGGFGRGFERCWWTRAAQKSSPLAWFHHGAGRFGTGANMAFRRAVFAGIGPFDPALDVGTPTEGGGDLEMYFRVLQEGYTLVYEPRALVRHRHRRSMEGLYRQIASWGQAPFVVKHHALQRYPEERRGFRHLTRWWLRDIARRLGKSLLRRTPVPPSLVWAEARSAWRGAASLRRAQAQAATVQQQFGPHPAFSGDSFAGLPPMVTPSPIPS